MGRRRAGRRFQIRRAIAKAAGKEKASKQSGIRVSDVRTCRDSDPAPRKLPVVISNVQLTNYHIVISKTKNYVWVVPTQGIRATASVPVVPAPAATVDQQQPATLKQLNTCQH